MVDKDLVLTKAGNIKKHLRRVEKKAKTDLKTFLEDLDRQEIIAFNLEVAVQNCIDIAAHIIGAEGLGVPGSTAEMFYLLEENDYLSSEITEKMIKAVGLRNLIAHEYGKIDLKQIYKISQNDYKDLNTYLVAIFEKLGLRS
jgi:uncharacterized protein YutE (UPF0331/DUF86 family)